MQQTKIFLTDTLIKYVKRFINLNISISQSLLFDTKLFPQKNSCYVS